MYRLSHELSVAELKALPEGALLVWAWSINRRTRSFGLIKKTRMLSGDRVEHDSFLRIELDDLRLPTVAELTDGLRRFRAGERSGRGLSYLNPYGLFRVVGLDSGLCTLNVVI